MFRKVRQFSVGDEIGRQFILVESKIDDQDDVEGDIGGLSSFGR